MKKNNILTWEESYSNMILDEDVEEKKAAYEHAKEYRKYNYIKGNSDHKHNELKQAGAAIKDIVRDKWKKLDEPF